MSSEFTPKTNRTKMATTLSQRKYFLFTSDCVCIVVVVNIYCIDETYNCFSCTEGPEDCSPASWIAWGGWTAGSTRRPEGLHHAEGPWDQLCSGLHSVSAWSLAVMRRTSRSNPKDKACEESSSYPPETDSPDVSRHDDMFWKGCPGSPEQTRLSLPGSFAVCIQEGSRGGRCTTFYAPQYLVILKTTASSVGIMFFKYIFDGE